MVDRTDDTNVAICSNAANDCSLRGAINLANRVAGTDTISFDASVFAPGTITLGSDLPMITTDINITGLGAAMVTVDGANNHRPFNIDSGVTVHLSGLTITHGNASAVAGGGGILNSGTLTVSDSIISDGAANSGAGIYNFGGNITLTNSTVSGNAASGSGGGIYNDNAGTMTMLNSTISGNTAHFFGGGIHINSGTMTLTNGTISGNSAVSGGGGISHQFRHRNADQQHRQRQHRERRRWDKQLWHDQPVQQYRRQERQHQ